MKTTKNFRFCKNVLICAQRLTRLLQVVLKVVVLRIVSYNKFKTSNIKVGVDLSLGCNPREENRKTNEHHKSLNKIFLRHLHR